MTPRPDTLNETARTVGGATHYVVASWERDFGVNAGLVGGWGRGDFSLTEMKDLDSLSPSWATLRDAMGYGRIVVSRQVHGNRVKVHSSAEAPGVSILDGFDGHLTVRAGTLLTVTVADCVPVFLAEPGTGTLALLHAGWRGIAAGMLEAGVEAVIAASGSSANDVVMHCGISICGSCYEVGPEVVEAVTGCHARQSEGLDLRGALCARGADLGLGQVTTSSLCTAHGDGKFYSHRASDGAAGRMLAYLGQPTA